MNMNNDRGHHMNTKLDTGNVIAINAHVILSAYVGGALCRGESMELRVL